MTCHCEERSDEAIQPDGSPRRLAPARADRGNQTAPLRGQAGTRTHQKPSHATATQQQLADLWHVVVLNDPVNLMSYVVMVFKKIFGFDEMKARKHMLEVHEQGRSVVWSGVREQAEAYVFTLQQWHLTAVIEADESG